MSGAPSTANYRGPVRRLAARARRRRLLVAWFGNRPLRRFARSPDTTGGSSTPPEAGTRDSPNRPGSPPTGKVLRPDIDETSPAARPDQCQAAVPHRERSSGAHRRGLGYAVDDAARRGQHPPRPSRSRASSSLSRPCGTPSWGAPSATPRPGSPRDSRPPEPVHRRLRHRAATGRRGDPPAAQSRTHASPGCRFTLRPSRDRRMGPGGRRWLRGLRRGGLPARRPEWGHPARAGGRRGW